MRRKKDNTSRHYVLTLLKQATSIGLDTDSIANDLGLTVITAEGREDWVDNRAFTRLVKRLWAVSGDETLGFLSEVTKPGTTALVFEYMLAAKNLGGLFSRGQRILSYLPPTDFYYSFDVEGDFAKLDVGLGTAKDTDHFMTEFSLVVFHRFASWAIDEHIPLKQTCFTYDEPEHGWFYNNLFHSELSFASGYNGFEFSKKYLKRPIVRSERELEIWLKDSPADLMYLSASDPSMRAQVKTSLRSLLEADARMPVFEDICSGVNLTPQSVRRRLSNEGSSYQAIKNAVRRDLAVELLKNPHIPMTDIAARTGFSEAAAFSRAFKKWTGMNPASYQENL